MTEKHTNLDAAREARDAAEIAYDAARAAKIVAQKAVDALEGK